LIFFCFHIGEGFRKLYSQKQILTSNQTVRGSCKWACGAETVTVDDTEFNIGEHVKYRRTPTECFVDCQVGTSGIACPSGTSKKSKAGFARDKKLCCTSQKCTWRPPPEDAIDGGMWEEKVDSEEQLWPLQEWPEGRCNGNTCFCCSEKVFGWHGDVNLKCKHAYGGSVEDTWKSALGAAFTVGLSDLYWKHNCQKYCVHFPGYTIAKKALAAHVWEKSEIPPRRNPAEIAARLTEELEKLVADAKEELQKDRKKDFDVKKLLAFADAMGEAVEEATEQSDVAELMDQNLLRTVQDLLEGVEKDIVPTLLENAMALFPDAMAAQEAGNMKTLREIAKKIESAIFRADHVDPPPRNLKAARSLMKVLTDMIKELHKQD
jgi:hypothetical protein